MARERKRKEDRDKDDKRNRHHHDKDHKRHKNPPPKPGTPPPSPAPTVTEQLKAKSTQTGQDAMNATPSGYPADPANADAVFTTGPGQAVEYNYVRTGTYSEDYALQQSEQSAPVPPIAGNGQVVTSGAANNPT